MPFLIAHGLRLTIFLELMEWLRTCELGLRTRVPESDLDYIVTNCVVLRRSTAQLYATTRIQRHLNMDL